MIGQIKPLVQVAGRRVWLTAVAAHIAGAALSASILGAILGALGLATGLPQRAPLIADLIGCAALVACALRDIELWKWSLPSTSRQTPAWFRTAFGPVWSAFAWGADLAQGWTTHVTFASYYGLVLWAVLSGSPSLGGILLGAYGLGRALPVLAAGLAGHTHDLGMAHLSQLRLLHLVNASAATFVAGYMLGVWTVLWI